MNLHYSQTPESAILQHSKFYIPMNLHYSQTLGVCISSSSSVLYPYEFTLLSNKMDSHAVSSVVLYPYEFTLLSNWPWPDTGGHEFYIPMNLHYSQTGTTEELTD